MDRQTPIALRIGPSHWLSPAETASQRSPKSAADIAEILRSHAPWAPCRHAGPRCSLTEWSMVALPRLGLFPFSAGQVCQHGYFEHRLGI